MQPAKGIVIRLTLYAVVLGYLAGDLYWWHGPLHRRLFRAVPGSAAADEELKRQGVVARVGTLPIFGSQLDRAVVEHLWLRGLAPADLDRERLAAVRREVLESLIDQQLLRATAAQHAAELPVGEEEIDQAVKRFSARFAAPADLEQALKHEGIRSEREFRFRLAARLQQQKLVEERIAAAATVTDAEARAWFARHQTELARPERIHARHVFLATLERDPGEARNKLAEALALLEKKEADFATLAATLSEDDRTKGDGGDLGWFSRDRLPADFTSPVFAQPVGRPGLIRTSLGWHLVEVLARKPAGPRTFEEARSEVIAALGSAKRQVAIAQLRARLRAEAGQRIVIFGEAPAG